MDYLKTVVAKEASDLYLTVGVPPLIKIQNKLHPLESTPLTSQKVKQIADEIMDADQKSEFEKKWELNLALAPEGLGRFRINVFQQKNELALVFRHIKAKVPTLSELGLPPLLESLACEDRGLILFVGATGSGKSTSLASMIEHRNQTMDGHIITIEDPIEYVHTHKKSIISQREVGVDTKTYEEALHNGLRQAPDVMLIGEIRNLETMRHAIMYSETGHLVLSTLHSNNANQAIERIILFFPQSERAQILLDLSLNLKAIISQRLIPNTEGNLSVAVEILLATPLVRDFIKRDEISALKDLMEKSENLGMQTFDSALFKLCESGKITMEEALRHADSVTNLKLRFNLSQSVDKNATTKFSMKPDESGK